MNQITRSVDRLIHRLNQLHGGIRGDGSVAALLGDQNIHAVGAPAQLEGLKIGVLGIR